jgi:predicted outer membrane repeat protein
MLLGDYQMKSKIYNQKFMILSIMAMAVIFMSISPIFASEQTVYVNANSGHDYWDGSTASHAKQSIGSAVTNVNAGGTINIADGTYNGINNRNIIINKAMTIKGQNMDRTILNAEVQSRFFRINTNTKVSISGLTFKNGKSDKGGAIINNGYLTLTYCKFIGNKATTTDGGAIYNYHGTGKVNYSTFTYNSAPNSGAILNAWGSLNLYKSTFKYNKATVGYGGAVQNYYGSLTVTNSNFEANIGPQAGAILNDHGTAFNIIQSKFTGNKAWTGYGGAIYNYYGPLNIQLSSFISNRAYKRGGAISNGNSILNVYKSSFAGNKVTFGYGGAIANSRGTLKASKSSFKYNSASKGLSVYNYYSTGKINYSQIIGSGNQIFKYLGSFDARYNWWGSNKNPSGRVSSGVKVSPWSSRPF